MFFSGLYCDRCGTSLSWKSNIAKKYIIKWAREEGWSYNNKTETAFCPICKCKKKGGNKQC